MDVKTRVRNYFNKSIAQKVGDDDDIFELAVVDSLFAMQLVLFVEKEFSIIAEREDLDIKNFCSVAALTNFVLNKLGTAADLDFDHGHPSV